MDCAACGLPFEVRDEFALVFVIRSRDRRWTGAICTDCAREPEEVDGSLILNVETTITHLEHDRTARGVQCWRAGVHEFGAENQAKLARAKAIYKKLTGADWAPKPSEMSQIRRSIGRRPPPSPRWRSVAFARGDSNDDGRGP